MGLFTRLFSNPDDPRFLVRIAFNNGKMVEKMFSGKYAWETACGLFEGAKSKELNGVHAVAAAIFQCNGRNVILPPTRVFESPGYEGVLK